MAFYSKQVPTGTINGVNKTFTLANTIFQIDDIWIDGAIYSGTYTKSGAVVTLADAPTATITIDYWSTDPVLSLSTVTRLQLKQDFYEIVGEPTTSTVYPSSDSGGDYVELLANRVQDTICRENKWWFLKTKHLFKSASNTTLDGAVATTDTTVDLTSTTNYPTTGAIWTNEDIITYTGITANQLTGADNIDLAHSDGEDVEILYSVPSDFGHSPRLIVKASGGQPLRYIQVDELDDNVASADDHNYDFGGQNYRWSFVTDADGNEYIRLKNPSSSHFCAFHHYREASNMSSDSSTTTIPNKFARKIIPLFMAAYAMMERGDNPDGLADGILAQANQELNKMKAYNTKRLMQLRPKVFNMYRSGNGRRSRPLIIN